MFGFTEGAGVEAADFGCLIGLFGVVCLVGVTFSVLGINIPF